MSRLPHGHSRHPPQDPEMQNLRNQTEDTHEQWLVHLHRGRMRRPSTQNMALHSLQCREYSARDQMHTVPYLPGQTTRMEMPPTRVQRGYQSPRQHTAMPKLQYHTPPPHHMHQRAQGIRHRHLLQETRLLHRNNKQALVHQPLRHTGQRPPCRHRPGKMQVLPLPMH